MWYSNSSRIVPKDNTALGLWSTDNSQHPDFFIHHPEHTPSTSQTAKEETLAGGLHHIATLQGAIPFTPQEPILPQIEEAAAQGITITVDTAPATSVLPTQQPETPVIVASLGQNTLAYIPATMAIQGGSGQGAGEAAPIYVVAATGGTGQTITVAATATNGRLKGTLPPIFNGNRDKSHNFIVNFGIYRFANRNNNAMSNPATCITTALTYMEGPLVNPWKE